MADSYENTTFVKINGLSRAKSFLKFFGIDIVHFKKRIDDHGLRLRLLEMRDLSFLSAHYRPEHIPGIHVWEPGQFSSLFSLWKWLKASFHVFYLVEIKNALRDPIIGFVALYHLEIGRRLYIAVMLFNPEDRRRGYGRHALTMLFNFLKESGVVKEVCAEVFKSNVASLRLLQTLGFEVLEDQGGQLLLFKTIG